MSFASRESRIRLKRFYENRIKLPDFKTSPQYKIVDLVAQMTP